MRLTRLGWAGIELEADGETLVIDPLADTRAVFAAMVPDPATVDAPRVVAPSAGSAVAGLLTHLHRDHADAAALTEALMPGAPVYAPAGFGGEPLENLALAQAEHELAAAGIVPRGVAPWDRLSAGPFEVTALPALDGPGDPQVSWLVEHGGRRVLHLGDTAFHGYWWRIAQRHGPFDAVLVPVNGAVVSFPHRQPPSPFPVVLDPEQAAVAVEILAARLAIPVHDEGYSLPGLYEPATDPAARFAAAAEARGVPVRRLEPGEAIEL